MGILQMGIFPEYAHLNLLGNGNIKIKLPHYGNKKENLIVIIRNLNLQIVGATPARIKVYFKVNICLKLI